MTSYPKNWNEDAIDKYITQEAQEKSREVFEKTHVPINRIRVHENKEFSTWTDESERFVDEQMLLEAVTDSKLKDSNRLFFIVGESGSGKSELCQWLDYQIQDQSDEAGEEEFAHDPILIPRHVREPAEVLKILTEGVDSHKFENAKYLADLPEAGIFRETTGTIINRFNKADKATVEFLTSDSFEHEVEKNLDKYLRNFDDPDKSLTFEPIEKDELSSLLDQTPHVRHEHENHDIGPDEYLYKEIKRGATEALREMLFAGDIKKILCDVDKKYRNRNRRPVLIIEDLTGFTIYDHQIISFFSDLSTAHFDVIIGVTTGPYQRLIDQRHADLASEDTINDRIRARMNLTERTDDGSKTLFLEQENIHIDLARNYLRAIKQESNETFDSLPDDITPANIEEVFGEWLYPFNEPFLTRIYENLEEDNVKKQTPRIYLNFVIEELLNNANPPFEHAEKLQQRLGVIANPISSEYTKPDEPVLKWYGVESDGEYTVDTSIPKVFGIESDGTAPTVTGPKEICPDCGAQIYDDSKNWICSECGYQPDGEGDGQSRSDLFEELQNEMLAWRRGETDFNQTSRIENGAQRAIRYFYDAPNSLVRPECQSSETAYLRWEKGGDKVPIHVHNGDDPSYTQVVLTQDVDEKVLNDLLRIGVWEETSLSVHDRRGNIDLDRLREWAEEAVSELRSQLESDIESTFGVTIDEIALFGKYLLNVFSGTSTNFTPDALKSPIKGEQIATVYTNTDFEGDINRLANNADLLRALFHARFHIRKNIVDYEHLESELEAQDITTLLDRISSIEGELKGFKLGTSSSETMELESFLRNLDFNLRAYALDINEYERVYKSDLESIREEITFVYEQVEGFEGVVNLEPLEDAYAHIDRVGGLMRHKDLEQKQIDDTVDRLSTTVNKLRHCDSVWDFFVAYREVGILKNSDPWSDTYKALLDIVRELEKLEEAIDDKIEDLENESFEPETDQFDSAQTSARKLQSELKTVKKVIQ